MQVARSSLELKLPADYADMFFLHDTSRRGGDKPKTAKELRAALAVSDSERAALLAAIEEADKREQQEAGREAELEAKRLELEALEKQNAENAARRKQLEAEIAKAKKKQRHAAGGEPRRRLSRARPGPSRRASDEDRPRASAPRR